MRKIPFYQVDAFTKQAFRGNSAAVVTIHPEHLPLADEDRQLIASENNLAETAFVELRHMHDSFCSAKDFNLRWFTPSIEVPLCGHATIASAASLMFDIGNMADEITFHTLSGQLRVRRATLQPGAPPGDRPALTMSLPLIHPAKDLPEACKGDVSPLINAVCQGMQVKEVLFAKKLKFVLVVCENSRQELESLDPDISQAESCSTNDEIVGVIVSLLDGATICSRFFAPWAGIPEDPVTGSAHSILAAHYCLQAGVKSLAARQCSKRGGDLRVAISADGQTVDITGHAVTTIAGYMYVP